MSMYGWDQPGAGRDREDEWSRAERWSSRPESYRELEDTPQSIERMRRSDAAFRGKLYSAIAIPAGSWLAHLVQHRAGLPGFGWYTVFLATFVLVPQALFWTLHHLRNR